MPSLLLLLLQWVLLSLMNSACSGAGYAPKILWLLHQKTGSTGIEYSASPCSRPPVQRKKRLGVGGKNRIKGGAEEETFRA